jgi:phage tail sheath protein FI
MTIRLGLGTDGADEGSITQSAVFAAYDLFADPKSVDISLVLCGKSRQSDGITKVNYIIDNIGDYRKDCVVFASVPLETVVNNYGEEVNDMVSFAGELRPSSYAFLDSGYKYQYDKYNDIYRWVPLNGDIAGLAARTDHDRDVWWAFAGLNRGQIKNVTTLAYNPPQGVRDTLSKNSINAVISERGDGTFLFDDRTLLKQNSAFRQVSVRRLFITLEKAIATDAKYMLFEFNDSFTQAAFRNRVVPYLRDVMGRRGILDFQVICDSTNNTDEVVQNEQFVGDIYIKPARAIRGIQLNFVAVRGSVDFNEIVGQF